MSNSGLRQSRRTVIVFVGLVLAGIAWWWPGLSGGVPAPDVLITPSADLVAVRNTLDRRLREEGMIVEWLDTDNSSTSTGNRCGLGNGSPSRTSTLILMLADSGDCSELTALLEARALMKIIEPRRVVLVLAWRRHDEIGRLVAEELGIKVIDARSLIGVEGEDQPCLWWDDCPPTGRIRTVVAGELTPAGQQRLARVIVAGAL